MLYDRPSLRHSANPITSLTPVGGSSCVVRYLGRSTLTGGPSVLNIPAIGNLTRISNEAGNRTIVLIGAVGGTAGNLFKIARFCGQPIPVRYTVDNAAASTNCVRLFIASGNVPLNQIGPFVFEFLGSGSNFSSGSIGCWEIFGLNSPRPIDATSSTAATDTTRSIDLVTSAGGVILGYGFNNISAAQNCTWSGDQTPAEDDESGSESYCNLQNTNQDAANTLTATWNVISTVHATLIGASFR